MDYVKGTTQIDATAFRSALKMKNVVFSDLAKEIGLNKSYFTNIENDGVINTLVFKYICGKYGFIEGDFIPEPKEEKVEPVVQGSVDIANTLNSINKTLLEINRRLGMIADKQSTIDGKLANINVNTYETKTALQLLKKELCDGN